MPTTNYYSVNGEVYGESTDGVMTTYMKDAQGSVIGTIQAGGVVNTYAYTLVRSTLAKTGTGPGPRFMWNGGNQYRTTELCARLTLRSGSALRLNSGQMDDY